MNMLTILKMNAIAVWLALFIFTFGACHNKTQPTVTKETAEDQLEPNYDVSQKEEDAKFMVTAAETQLQEIELAKLAIATTNNKNVLLLSKTMQDFHQKAFNELKKLAIKNLIAIPMTITPRGQEALIKLTRSSGTTFDNNYVSMIQTSHKSAIVTFEKYIAISVDIEIKDWALLTLKALYIHLDMAKVAAAKLNLSNN